MVDEGNDGVYWDKPVKESCPKCSMRFLLEKTTKKDGTIRYCQNKDCDYKMAVDNANVTPIDKTEDAVPA
jgi:ssDNA-binding Zn-finger/Zn-ribbon topoisomerase 1